MKWIVPVVLLLLLVPFCLADDKKEEEPKPPQSIDELRQQIEKILKDTHTNGVSVAIVHKDAPEWVTGLGMADQASNRPATAETLFRIGSTSKAFVSLSVLLLADQGKLSLEDPVHKLVPEIWFENRWESTDPVRVVNLLEHTTGWDDIHLREYAKQAARFHERARGPRLRPSLAHITVASRDAHGLLQCGPGSRCLRGRENNGPAIRRLCAAEPF